MHCFVRRLTAVSGAETRCVAAVSARMVASPFDVIKIRLQVPRGQMVDPGTPRYVLHLVRTLYAEEGVRGFYR